MKLVEKPLLEVPLLFVLLSVAAYLGLHFFSGEFATFTRKRITSPNGKYIAEVFERMDARLVDSSSSSNVVVWPSGLPGHSAQQQIFGGHCWASGSREVDQGLAPVRVKWLADNSIEIACPLFFAVFVTREKVFDVGAQYVGEVDNEWLPEWARATAIS